MSPLDLVATPSKTLKGLLEDPKQSARAAGELCSQGAEGMTLAVAEFGRACAAKDVQHTVHRERLRLALRKRPSRRSAARSGAQV